MQWKTGQRVCINRSWERKIQNKRLLLKRKSLGFLHNTVMKIKIILIYYFTYQISRNLNV